ncbi:hypothetical protein PIB30_002490 [Stylosanthes scabra]|uniref:Uncharacterized protein n=1 Tax=Stylosanthes scabra TaxID=79078 RepID=A0ABU6X406_9FABA|nr:hypothetical protein [Stylosanthes scabra]
MALQYSYVDDNDDEANRNVAIIFGVTGLVGRELAKRLLLEPSSSNWKKVYGIARNLVPDESLPDYPFYHFISCNLLSPLETQKKLSCLHDVTHVFWVTWASQFPLETQESCEINKLMMSNALSSLLPNAKNLKHVSLQTGTKHYISLQGPFDNNNNNKFYYYHEEFPRICRGFNFYYTLEDLLMEKLNGTKKCWEENYIDGSDARLVADQHIWAATKCDEDLYLTNGGGGGGEAFNSVNGFGFTWKEMWPIIGKKLGVYVPQEMVVENFLYSRAMAEKQHVWEEIVMENGLVQTSIENLANWEFLDALFRCPFKLLGSRDKVDRLGFRQRFKTLNSILYWIDCMRDEKLIP